MDVPSRLIVAADNLFNYTIDQSDAFILDAKVMEEYQNNEQMNYIARTLSGQYYYNIPQCFESGEKMINKMLTDAFRSENSKIFKFFNDNIIMRDMTTDEIISSNISNRYLYLVVNRHKNQFIDKINPFTVFLKLTKNYLIDQDISKLQNSITEELYSENLCKFLQYTDNERQFCIVVKTYRIAHQRCIMNNIGVLKHINNYLIDKINKVNINALDNVCRETVSDIKKTLMVFSMVNAPLEHAIGNWFSTRGMALIRNGLVYCLRDKSYDRAEEIISQNMDIVVKFMPSDLIWKILFSFICTEFKKYNLAFYKKIFNLTVNCRLMHLQNSKTVYQLLYKLKEFPKTSSLTNCGICYGDYKENDVVAFCPNCRNNICQDCVRSNQNIRCAFCRSEVCLGVFRLAPIDRVFNQMVIRKD